MKKETIVLLLKVVGGTTDREDLELIAGMDFNSMQDIRDAVEGVECYTLTDFMDACNDSDDDASFIDISVNWIGYVNLITQ